MSYSRLHFSGASRPKIIFHTLFFLLMLSCNIEAEEIFDNFRPPIEREILYRYPTERFIEAHWWDNIYSGLKILGVSLVHKNLFDRVWHKEQPGFLGYHGSIQEYRIYQDTIRLILEEHVKITIRADFHYFRIPSDPQFHHQTLQEYGDYQWNYSHRHFLRMNYALYENFQYPGSCSNYYFADNSSLTHINYETNGCSLANRTIPEYYYEDGATEFPIDLKLIIRLTLKPHL